MNTSDVLAVVLSIWGYLLSWAVWDLVYSCFKFLLSLVGADFSSTKSHFH